MGDVTFAVVPSVLPAPGTALDTLAQTLSPLVKEHVVGLRAESYAAIVEGLEKDRIQLAWMSPMLVVLAQERLPLRPLVTVVRRGGTECRSVLFVNDRSPFRTLEDLRGRTVAWVDPTSAAGYLYPRLHLAARGVDPMRLFGRELFLRSHGDVVRSVFDGAADVGATFAEQPTDGGPIRRAGFIEVDPGRPVRVLEWTGQMPNDMVVASGRIPTTLHDAVERALIGLGAAASGRQLLQKEFYAQGFVAASQKTLGPLRQLIHLARTHGLLPHL